MMNSKGYHALKGMYARLLSKTPEDDSDRPDLEKAINDLDEQLIKENKGLKHD